MPFLNIRITDEHVRLDQNGALVKRVSRAVFDVLSREPATTLVVIDGLSCKSKDSVIDLRPTPV